MQLLNLSPSHLTGSVGTWCPLCSRSSCPLSSGQVEVCIWLYQVEVYARYQPGGQPDPDDHLLQDQTGTDSGGEWAKQVTRTRGNTDVTAAWPKCSRGPPGSRCVKARLFAPAGGRLQEARASKIHAAVTGGHVRSDGLGRRTCSPWGKAQEKACKNV